MGSAGAEDVADAQGVGPQHLGDQRDAIPIAGGHVEDRFDALAGHERSGGQGGHAHPVAIVADAQGVDLAGEAFGQLLHAGRRGLRRRRNLGQKDRVCPIPAAAASPSVCSSIPRHQTEFIPLPHPVQTRGMNPVLLRPARTERTLAQRAELRNGVVHQLLQPLGRVVGEQWTNTARSGSKPISPNSRCTAPMRISAAIVPLGQVALAFGAGDDADSPPAALQGVH